MSGRLPVYKVVVAGDGGVGKTSLIRRYCEGKFEQSRLMTIGVDFQTKLVNVGGRDLRLSIWDVAGQEHFSSFRNTFYQGAQAIALVYDVTAHRSFTNLACWREEILAIQPNVPMLLIANKADLPPAFPAGEARAWANQHGMPYLEASAATGNNVLSLFNELAHLAVTGVAHSGR